MSDAALRERERRWLASGAPDDELAWLDARVRAAETLGEREYARLATLSAESSGIATLKGNITNVQGSLVNLG